mmetsp:Transcript_14793/g.27829  ORF Transcript_14793/g.27829 Transcript_14793/m.27829 type:complete len:728 (-) Transcript_14793:90-2273(-)|eukprot:CAMPEP_0176501022 /NCGR_PEP_ID=MMETSP0200_2-20121128/13917_1 /TAXON_ID=947934 /ORGANISM="Chaetoceros sp., Strain GSL56" /LENGTH=727 /DNA_ID=CAMNT_0017899837 /DNA_START=391 /DNA_END=2574 /DNA_ORIENTATION=-
MNRNLFHEDDDKAGFSFEPPTLQGQRKQLNLLSQNHGHTSTTIGEKQQQQQQQQQQGKETLSFTVDDRVTLFTSRKRPSSRDFDTTLSGVDNNSLSLNYANSSSCQRHDFSVTANGFDFNFDDHEENVIKIRRLNLNDSFSEDDYHEKKDVVHVENSRNENNDSLVVSDDDKAKNNHDHDNAISPVNNLPTTVTHAHTVVRKPCSPSNSFFISPNDVMMDPYNHNHHNDIISKRLDGMIASNVFHNEGLDNRNNYSRHDDVKNETDALNSTVETLDTSVQLSQPPSPTLFDFESDFFSPPAAPVKKAAPPSVLGNKLSCIDENDGYQHRQFINENHVLPLESFYNRIGTSNSSPMQVPHTPMTQRKAPSGRRIPLFQLSPHKKKPSRDFHASVFGELSTPSSYSNGKPLDHGKSHVKEVICGGETSRLSQDFQIIGTLGDGSFGTVYKCLSRLDGCTYAIKASKRRAKGRSDRERMLQEVKALAVLSDVSDVAAFHIVRYHQAWIEDERLHIVTDLCTSTLHAEMMRGLIKDDTQRQYKLLREMLLALKLIHQHGKVHLDIKPDNIFVKDDMFKLGDFGLAVEESTVGEVEEGDCRYMCRDLMSGNHRDLTKCDIFSLGITLYQVIVDRDLPPDGQEWHDLRSGKLGSMTNAPLELQEIIRKMMHQDGQERPTAAELLTRRQLLSEEQKKLIAEQNKAKEAQRAWEAKLKKMTPPKKVLQRSNTCPR